MQPHFFQNSADNYRLQLSTLEYYEKAILTNAPGAFSSFLEAYDRIFKFITDSPYAQSGDAVKAQAILFRVIQAKTIAQLKNADLSAQAHFCLAQVIANETQLTYTHEQRRELIDFHCEQAYEKSADSENYVLAKEIIDFYKHYLSLAKHVAELNKVSISFPLMKKLAEEEIDPLIERSLISGTLYHFFCDSKDTSEKEVDLLKTELGYFLCKMTSQDLTEEFGSPEADFFIATLLAARPSAFVQLTPSEKEKLMDFHFSSAYKKTSSPDLKEKILGFCKYYKKQNALLEHNFTFPLVKQAMGENAEGFQTALRRATLEKNEWEQWAPEEGLQLKQEETKPDEWDLHSQNISVLIRLINLKVPNPNINEETTDLLEDIGECLKKLEPKPLANLSNTEAKQHNEDKNEKKAAFEKFKNNLKRIHFEIIVKNSGLIKYKDILRSTANKLFVMQMPAQAHLDTLIEKIKVILNNYTGYPEIFDPLNEALNYLLESQKKHPIERKLLSAGTTLTQVQKSISPANNKLSIFFQEKIKSQPSPFRSASQALNSLLQEYSEFFSGNTFYMQALQLITLETEKLNDKLANLALQEKDAVIPQHDWEMKGEEDAGSTPSSLRFKK